MTGRAKSPAIPARLRLLQQLDRVVGPLALRIARPLARDFPRAGEPAPLPASAVRRVLVIRPGGLGDALLLLPTLRALRAAWPGVDLDVLAEGRNAPALRIGDPPWRVLRYDRAPLALWRDLRRSRYDLVIDTEQYHHLSVLLANRLRPRWLCGFGNFGRGRLQTHPVPHSEDAYEARSFLSLAEAVTGRHVHFDTEAPFLAPPLPDVEWARRKLAAAAGRPVVVLMPAAGGSYRIWPAERYAAVAQRLAAAGCFIVLLGAGDAAPACRLIAAGLDAGNVLDLAGGTTLPRSAAVLSLAGLAICADTGVLHLAYAVGTPTVSLFGPGLFRKWAPPGARHRLVRKALPCSPCIRQGRLPRCPYGIACMRDISADEVSYVAAGLLGTAKV